MSHRIFSLLVVVLAAACASSPNVPEPVRVPVPAPAPPATTASVCDVTSVPTAADRDDADKKLDDGRKPAALLAFAGICPGMHVAEISSGGGYTSELLARAVGPTGVVYAQNSKWILEKFAEKPWSARLAKPVNKNIVRSDRELDAPLPPEAKDLDAVLIILTYHDTVWQGADRAKMNKAVFDALKPGGVYVVVDHAAADGHGTDDAKTFHRIDEKTVKAEVTAAGFVLAEEADFLRNPADTHDWNDSPGAAAERRGTSDRFALKFKRP